METNGSRAVTINEARERLGGIGRTLFFKLVNNGRLRVIKLGARTLVPESEIQRLVSTDPAQKVAE
ncbi:MAG TPA: hypothetical protein VFQ88_04630 [Nevskiaceae bacterium]|nr:hypothetical protein [Nevskiaceae bacterium]